MRLPFLLGQMSIKNLNTSIVLRRLKLLLSVQKRGPNMVAIAFADILLRSELFTIAFRWSSRNSTVHCGERKETNISKGHQANSECATYSVDLRQTLQYAVGR